MKRKERISIVDQFHFILTEEADEALCSVCNIVCNHFRNQLYLLNCHTLSVILQTDTTVCRLMSGVADRSGNSHQSAVQSAPQADGF